MNAGRDVERLIASWLVEESPGRAPDRILDGAARTIDRTKQRRFAAAWREPMSISLRGIAAAAAVVVVLVTGAAWLGRSTAAVGSPGSTETRTIQPSPSAAGPTVSSYKAARDSICTAAWPQRQALDARIGTGLTDPATPASQRAAEVAALQDEMTFERSLVVQLHSLDIPASMAVDEASWRASVSGIFPIVDQEVALIQAGKLSEAAAVDLTTNPLARASEQFDSKYGLKPCP